MSSLSSAVEIVSSLPPLLAIILLLPHTLMLLSALRTVFSLWQRVGLHGLYKRVAGTILSTLSAAVPGVSGLVAKEVDKELAGLEKSLLGDGDDDAILVMPASGSPATTVAKRAMGLRGTDSYTTQHGKQWGGIYHHSESELTELQGKVWAAFNTSNALYPQCFPSLRRIEAELVSMTVGIVHGHEAGAVGLLSSGGTESVLIAALAYREQGRKKGITHPQIVCGLSAHPAIVKACHYFGIELLKAPVEAGSNKLRASAVKPLLTRNTVAIYASAPSFSFGCVDAIEELGELATAHGCGLHVDNCLGGYLLSFMSKEGRFDTPWDFAVPGVTTMSIDLHKYGYASKGVSVVAFRDPELRRLTYVPTADGCEGLYVTPTLQGSRGGAVMAVAWATLLHMGEDGYRKSANEITDAHEAVKAAVRTIPGLSLCGDSTCAVVPLCGANGLNVYAFATLMEQRGWGVFTGQKPATCSIPIGDHTPELLPGLIKDLRACAEYLTAHPEFKPSGNAAVYGAAASIPDAVLEAVLRGYIDVKLKVKPSDKALSAAGTVSAAGTAGTPKAKAASGASGNAKRRASKSPAPRR